MKDFKIKQKKNKVNNLSLRLKSLEQQLARALADYDNLRKRFLKESEEYEKKANLRLIAKLLPIYDMLENAYKHVNDSGIAITLEEFKRTLSEEGIEQIKLDKDFQFDEQLHEAVEVVENNDSNKAGKIANILLSGWRLTNGQVVRPAKVKVYGKNNRN